MTDLSRRIEHRVERGEPVSLTIDGRPVTAWAGETLAAVLLAEGITVFNRAPSGAPRGPWCNMGTCYECQVRVAGKAGDEAVWERACIRRVEPGLAVVTGARLGLPGDRDDV